MSVQITDLDGVPITYLGFTLEESVDGEVFTIRVPCGAGQWLKAEENVDVSIFARPLGTMDAFVDLAIDPISLGPYAGTNAAFDLYLHTNAVAGLVSTAVALTATFNP